MSKKNTTTETTTKDNSKAKEAAAKGLATKLAKEEERIANLVAEKVAAALAEKEKEIEALKAKVPAPKVAKDPNAPVGKRGRKAGAAFTCKACGQVFMPGDPNAHYANNCPTLPGYAEKMAKVEEAKKKAEEAKAKREALEAEKKKGTTPAPTPDAPKAPEKVEEVTVEVTSGPSAEEVTEGEYVTQGDGSSLSSLFDDDEGTEDEVQVNV